jgi:GTP cyclohydrolase II
MEADAYCRRSKPYLVYAIEECVRCAQKGGVGVVVYFRKEGRALGEVTK